MPDSTLDIAALGPLAEARDFAALAAALAESHAADVADFLQGLDEEALHETFRRLPTELAAAVLIELEEPMQDTVVDLATQKPEVLARLVDEMEADDAADFIDAIVERSPELAETVLERISDALEADVRTLRRYAPESAGGLMQSEYFAVPADSTVAEVLDAMRRFAKTHESRDHIHNVFAVDRAGRFVGTADLYGVVTAAPDTTLRELIDPEAPFAPAFLDQEEVALLFRRHDVVSLPVTDLGGTLVGRVTADDVFDVVEEEATEDMYRLAGVAEDEHVLDRPGKSIRKRMPWLFVNMVTALITATVISFFQGTFDLFPMVAVFMPMVGGLGGNAGIQTLTITVRGLALGELEFNTARRAIIKEIIVGLANGLFVGIAMGLIAYAWKGSLMLSVGLFLALIANLFVGVMAGTLVPLVLKKLNSDPALASGIFVTALTDSFGFFVFLGIATALLTRFG